MGGVYLFPSRPREQLEPPSGLALFVGLVFLLSTMACVVDALDDCYELVILRSGMKRLMSAWPRVHVMDGSEYCCLDNGSRLEHGIISLSGTILASRF